MLKTLIVFLFVAGVWCYQQDKVKFIYHKINSPQLVTAVVPETTTTITSTTTVLTRTRTNTITITSEVCRPNNSPCEFEHPEYCCNSICARFDFEASPTCLGY
ncbi:uncharacterized protein B0P05DRAFT_561509 [Gilbertella persicaria]|uniref:uncharacterized protein n=1 Tax=Gilbertella persicaria TaxID=101096 RepID=UPI0022210A65|nr:uncharacterized protein B0P05DRAFT_561509 [Gilbertella persicaria]KAI8053673.1 hypothetical protein B0P05DRAFT_561509 [Gilbertella persicaria]